MDINPYEFEAPWDKYELATVERCRLKPVESRVEPAWFQRLKPKCDEPLSKPAFDFNFRRYTTACKAAGASVLLFSSAW